MLGGKAPVVVDAYEANFGRPGLHHEFMVQGPFRVAEDTLVTEEIHAHTETAREQGQVG